jgi:hypothetical protein
MTFQVKAEVLLNNANWEKNLKKTSKQMEGFGKSMKSISGAVKAAWLGVAALGIGAVYDALVDVTKAAAEDQRTTALLNSTLEKNWKATDKQKESVDAYINSIGAMTGYMDDDLKKAYGNVARLTKSQTKANKMLALSADIAADKNISVEKASKLVAKAMAGNQKAFDKLYPSASKFGDALGYVTKQTSGMAALAGENNPFARIDFVINEFKEKVGKAFLPVANNVAEWLASPEAQKALDDIASQVQKAFAFLTSPEGKAQMKEWMDTFLVLINGALTLAQQVADIIGADKKKSAGLTAALNTRKGSEAFNFLGGGPTGRFKLSSAESLQRSAGNMSTVGGATTINIYGTVSGNDVVKALKNIAGQKGMTLGRLLR